MPLARRTAILATLAACLALAACGSSDEETGTSAGTTQAGPSSPPASEAPLGVTAKSCAGAEAQGGEVRVTGASCELARRTVAAWARSGPCSPTPDSRTSCRLGEMICLGARTDRGLAVTCATTGRTVVFVARRG